MSDVEAQMRRALGLYGGGNRARPEQERTDQPPRTMDRFTQTPQHQGLHRRRFVQDGEVPVTVVRREPGSENVAPAAPQSSRLQRTEAALAAETAARDKAERALVEANNHIRDLQTKIGHAELSRAEAVEAARRDREAVAGLRGSSSEFEEQLQVLRDQVEAADRSRHAAQAALAEERSARKHAERALRDATDRAERAESIREMLEQDQAQQSRERESRQRDAQAPEARSPVRGRPRLVVSAQREPTASRDAVSRDTAHRKASPVARPAEVKPLPAKRGRPAKAPTPVSVAQEAEPVKWWLMPSPKAKRRQA